MKLAEDLRVFRKFKLIKEVKNTLYMANRALARAVGIYRPLRKVHSTNSNCNEVCQIELSASR